MPSTSHFKLKFKKPDKLLWAIWNRAMEVPLLLAMYLEQHFRMEVEARAGRRELAMCLRVYTTKQLWMDLVVDITSCTGLLRVDLLVISTSL